MGLTFSDRRGEDRKRDRKEAQLAHKHRQKSNFIQATVSSDLLRVFFGINVIKKKSVLLALDLLHPDPEIWDT